MDNLIYRLSVCAFSQLNIIISIYLDFKKALMSQQR